MTDRARRRVIADRPATHRRGRRCRPPAERLVYEQLRVTAVAPVVVVAAFFCVAIAIWQAAMVPAGVLLVWGGCGAVPAAVVVGLWRSGVAARTVWGNRACAVEQLISEMGSVTAVVREAGEQLRHGAAPAVPRYPGPPHGDDPLAAASYALGVLGTQAVQTVIEAHTQSQLVVRHEMFRHISRREHALVSRLLDALADLQNQIKAAALLNQVFKIDNQAVRLKRLVESLAILGGESASTVRHPVTVTNVLRGSVQEVEQYERARVVTSSHDALLAMPGHVAPDVTHLLAELVENATQFSAPDTIVELRAQLVAAGLAIEIIDRARPMPSHVRDQMNALIAAPHLVDVSAQLADGRIGLLVVGMTAQRHGIHVTLSPNPAGGTTALIVIPQRLLVNAEPDPVLLLAAQSSSHGQDGPEAARATPAPSPAPATDGGLPQRRRQPAADAPLDLPVRQRTSSPLRGRAGQDAGAGSAPTRNTGLAGAFLKGSQRAQAQERRPPVPRQGPDPVQRTDPRSSL